MISRKLWFLVFVTLIITTANANAASTDVSYIIGVAQRTDQGAIVTLRNTNVCNGVFRVTNTTPTPFQQWIVDAARTNYFGPNKPVLIEYTGDSGGWWCEITSLTICNTILDSMGHCQ